MRKIDKSKRRAANIRKKYALLAALGVLAVLVISLIVFLISLFLKAQKPGLPVMQTTEEESSTEDYEENTKPVLEGRSGILLYVFEPKDSLEYLWLIDADLSESLISVSAISPNTSIDEEGQKLSLKTHYENGKAKQLIKAAENLSGKKIDRHLGFEHKDFVKLIKEFGVCDVYIESDISYNTDDVNLQLKEGMQKLDFNSLPNYLKYISDVKKDINLQSELMCSMINSYVNERNIEKSETLFEILINLSESDINAYDFFNNKSILKYIAKDEIDIVSKNLNNR